MTAMDGDVDGDHNECDDGDVDVVWDSNALDGDYIYHMYTNSNIAKFTLLFGKPTKLCVNSAL